MSPAETRLQVERAIVELANADEAVTLMAAAVRARIGATLRSVTAVRDAFDARAEEVRVMLAEQARDDAATAAASPELQGEPADGWFDSWLADSAGEHGVEPLTVDEARAVYVAAFNGAKGGANG